MNCNNFNNNMCRCIPLIIRKVDSVTGAEIPGAVFELVSGSGFTCRGTTDSNGLLVFCVFPCNTFTLKEVGVPTGYAPVAHIYKIRVDACGCIFIDGAPTSQLIIRNTPISASFTAVKVNIENGMPLADAVYTLYMNSTVVATAVSNAAGQVAFTGLSAGTYELMETAPPQGFQMNPESLTVIVDQNRSVTINGQSANGFRLNDVPIAISAPPTINTITEGASVISGTGVPGAAITVTLPNGLTVSTTVNSSGTWLVNVPVGVELVAGEIVSAIQTEPGKLPSIQVSVTVVPKIEPFLEKTVENLTTPGGAVTPGDTLQYTILIGNLGGTGSVWPNAVLTDFIDENVTFISGTVAIDNQLIPVGTDVGQYTFDSVARKLTIRVGDIASGVIRAVTFQVTVNLDIVGEVIENEVTAGSEPVMAVVSPTIIVEG